MDHFLYKKGQLYCEDVNVDELAKHVSTPFYLYSKSTIETHYEKFYKAFEALKPEICYSIKNCNNINIIKTLVDKGSGIDVVSGGEVYKALQGGADPAKIVFAGVGKTEQEIRYAIESKVGWINVESEQEFEIASRIAEEMKAEVKVALRINPNVFDEKTPIQLATGKVDSKFGVDISHAIRFFEKYSNHPYFKLLGIHIHLGSPIYSSLPYEIAIKKILDLCAELEQKGFSIEMIDIGGGFIAYYDGQEKVSSWEEYGTKIVPLLKPFVDRGGKVVLEPGRSIMANSGVLISEVQYTKRGLTKKFVVTDAGMSHLLRPALYEAYHFIWPTNIPEHLEPQNRSLNTNSSEELELYDIVGPICESTDYLGKDRRFPEVKRGDLVSIFTVGAYGIVMSSQYNAALKPMEIMVSGDTASIIGHKQEYEDLVTLEKEVKEIDLT